MTLLAVCHDVADAVGVQRPLAILSGQDQLSRQMLALAQETLEELSLMDWPILENRAVVTTVSGQLAYDLPPDFEHQVGDTMFYADRYQQLRGQLTPGDWARQRNNLGIGTVHFRIVGWPLRLNINPTPQLVEDLVYEYKVNNRVKRFDTTLAPKYVDDADVSLVPEELVRKGLKWRLRRAKGLDYTEEFDDYEFSRTTRLAQQLQFGSMPVALRSPWSYEGLSDGYVPETGFGP